MRVCVSCGGNRATLVPIPAFRDLCFVCVRNAKGRERRRASQLRQKVFCRDNYRCVRCGMSERDWLEVDHKTPIDEGGTSSLGNLQTLCKDCNNLKGTMSDEEFRSKFPPLIPMKSSIKVIIYTDGACSGNPGPGGYGAVLQYGDSSKELSSGFRKTTNNRMELLAVIEGLTALKRPCDVTVFSDSKYIVDAVNKGWARRWRANGWKRNKRERALNPDLWANLLKLLDHHDVSLRWVKGHAGNPGNERADALAVAASQGENLAIDEGYEAQVGATQLL